MFLTSAYRGLVVDLILAIAAVSAAPAAADGPGNLFTPGNTFTLNSHIVSATVFHWFEPAGGQVEGPWRPLEGRPVWTGEPAFWETQLKQIMAANIDVLLVELIPNIHEQQRVNLFQAIYNLRAQGYNAPKITPFLDTVMTASSSWPSPSVKNKTGAGDLATATGKDAYVDQYVRFFQQYYSVNPDADADGYIAQIDGRVVLDSWHLIPPYVVNAASLTRADVQSRLANALGRQHLLFRNLPANGLFVIHPSSSAFTFAEEGLTQFEVHAYYHENRHGPRIAAQLKPGYWDQNIRKPGFILRRDGGKHYREAWTTALNARAGGLKHVNIESWNEYDEGSGIYAANPGPPYITAGSGNAQTDVWSATNDPYEYIKTTAAGARQFNDAPDLDARILWHNFPATMRPGERRTVQVIVRNEGDVSWTGAAGFKLGEEENKDSVMFGPGRYAIDDATHEIPTYGGVFRGRPVKFNVELTAPTTAGVYTTHWRMVQENAAWFGQELVWKITVAQ